MSSKGIHQGAPKENANANNRGGTTGSVSKGQQQDLLDLTINQVKDKLDIDEHLGGQGQLMPIKSDSMAKVDNLVEQPKDTDGTSGSGSSDDADKKENCSNLS